jgi:hypothetical protein
VIAFVAVRLSFLILAYGAHHYVPAMSSAAPWASTAGNKFREAARSTENPTTKLLAEGLTALAEALRGLDAKLEKVEQHVRSSTT